MATITLRRGESSKEVCFPKATVPGTVWKVGEITLTTTGEDLSKGAWRITYTGSTLTEHHGVLDYVAKDARVTEIWPSASNQQVVLAFDIDCGGASNPLNVVLVA